MCFSQVGNCDLENACERVDIWCLGGISICSPMEQFEKMSASYYYDVLLVMYSTFVNLETESDLFECWPIFAYHT